MPLRHFTITVSFSPTKVPERVIKHTLVTFAKNSTDAKTKAAEWFDNVWNKEYWWKLKAIRVQNTKYHNL